MMGVDYHGKFVNGRMVVGPLRMLVNLGEVA